MPYNPKLNPEPNLARFLPFNSAPMPNAKPGDHTKLGPRRMVKSSAYAALKRPKNATMTIKNFFIQLPYLGTSRTKPRRVLGKVPCETVHETRLLALYES